MLDDCVSAGSVKKGRDFAGELLGRFVHVVYRFGWIVLRCEF